MKVKQFDETMAELRTETARYLRGIMDKGTYENGAMRGLIYSQAKKAKEQCDELHQFQIEQIKDIGCYANAVLNECMNGHMDRAKTILARLIDVDANTSDTSAF